MLAGDDVTQKLSNNGSQKVKHDLQYLLILWLNTYIVLDCKESTDITEFEGYACSVRSGRRSEPADIDWWPTWKVHDSHSKPKACLPAGWNCQLTTVLEAGGGIPQKECISSSVTWGQLFMCVPISYVPANTGSLTGLKKYVYFVVDMIANKMKRNTTCNLKEQEPCFSLYEFIHHIEGKSGLLTSLLPTLPHGGVSADFSLSR